MPETEISPETIDELLTKYIVGIHNTYEQDDAVNDICKLKELLQENPTLTLHPSPTKSMFKSSEEAIDCTFSELPATDMYDYLHFSPGLGSSSPAPVNEFAEVQTKYIIELYEKFDIIDAVSTLEQHKQLLQTDPLIHIYLLSDTTIWSYSTLCPIFLKENLPDSCSCKFSLLSPELMYFVLNKEESSRIKYQPTVQAWA